MKRDGRKREHKENNSRSNERKIKVIKMLGDKKIMNMDNKEKGIRAENSRKG